MTTPVNFIDPSRYSSEYIQQPGDYLELIGGMNRLNRLLSTDSVITRTADGTVQDGDLVSSRPFPGTAGVANTDVGPIGIAASAAQDGEEFSILTFGTRELRIQLDDPADVPVPGWSVYMRRPNVEGFRWVYGVAEELPDGTILCGNVVSEGSKVENLWTGICDIRIGPGLSVIGQIDTGCVLWTGDEDGCRVQGTVAATSLDPVPEIRWTLPSAVPVSDVSFIAGDLWLRTGKESTSTNQGVEWSNLTKFSINLDFGTYNNDLRWQNDPSDVFLNTGLLSTATSVNGSFSSNGAILPDPATGSFVSGRIFRIVSSIQADTGLNALRWRIHTVSAGSRISSSFRYRFAFGFNEFIALGRNAVADSEHEALNSYTG